MDSPSSSLTTGASMQTPAPLPAKISASVPEPAAMVWPPKPTMRAMLVLLSYESGGAKPASCAAVPSCAASGVKAHIEPRAQRSRAGSWPPISKVK